MRLPEPARYPSAIRPDEFEVDWTDFYHRADLAGDRVRSKVRHRRHIRYGPDPSQVLNLLHPAEEADGAPLLAFLHGGAFREGHPDHYDMLALPYLEAGITFASVGYRLRPSATVADAIEDGADAVAWLWERVQSPQGVRPRLVISGHSAGATICASLAVRLEWRRVRGLPEDLIAGLVGVSGDYDLAGRTDIDEDRDRLRSLDPSGVLQTVPTRALLAFGAAEANRRGADRTRYARSARALATGLRSAGCEVTLLELPEANHIDTAAALGDRSGPVAAAVVKMLGGS